MELSMIIKMISDRQDIYHSKIEKWSDPERYIDMGDKIEKAEFAIAALDYLKHDFESISR